MKSYLEKSASIQPENVPSEVWPARMPPSAPLGRRPSRARSQNFSLRLTRSFEDFFGGVAAGDPAGEASPVAGDASLAGSPSSTAGHEVPNSSSELPWTLVENTTPESAGHLFQEESFVKCANLNTTVPLATSM